MISNPLVVALGSVLYEQRLEFAKEQNIGKGEAMYIIADRCAVADSTLRGIESGNKAPSVSVANRLIKSGIYKLDYSKLILVIGVLEEIGDAVLGWDRYIEKCCSIVSLNPDDDICDIIETSKSVEFDKCGSNEHVKRQIQKNGVFEKMKKYLSHDNHLPKRRTRYYAEFAETEKDIYDLLVLWEKLLPGRSPSPRLFKLGWNKNPQLVTIIYSNMNKDSIVGYFVIAALSLQAMNGIMTGKYKVPGDLYHDRDGNICSNYDDASALFLSYVSGRSSYGSAHVISEMFHQITALLNKPNIVAVFSRDASEKGKGLMSKFGFEQIPNSEMSMLPLTQDKLESNGIDRILTYS